MIDPRGLDLHQWADAVVLTVRETWPYGRLIGSDWQSWAVGFLRSSAMSGNIPPDPYQFTDWREWAMRAAPMLEAAS